jgi:pimeloyl-ACP methyl ester carboxylesterase
MMQRVVLSGLLSTVLAVCLLAMALPASAADYQVLGSVTSNEQGLVRTETSIAYGANPLDRFKMVRLVRNAPPAQRRATLLLLPPLGTNFSFYEQPDEGGPIGTSIAGFFARRGYDVYGYSPRLEGIPGGTCEVGVLDCSAMAGWNIASVVEDVAFVRGLIEAANPGAEVFVGGVSLGAMSAVATVNEHPGDYAGAILWEGMLFSLDPDVRALNIPYCAQQEALLAAGLYFDGVGAGVIKQVTYLASTRPDDLTPMPLFPPFLTNHQVMVGTFSQITPGPITLPVPNYLLINGSLAEDRFFHASEPRLFTNIASFNEYSPTALVRDVSCSLAGVETAYVDALDHFTGPVLAIGGGFGFGPYMQDQLDLFGSEDVTLLLTPEFAHIDHFMTEEHRRYVEFPILRWLRRHGS